MFFIEYRFRNGSYYWNVVLKPNGKTYTVFSESGALNDYGQIITYSKYIKRKKVSSLAAALEIAHLLYDKRLKGGYEFLKMRCRNEDVKGNPIGLFTDRKLYSDFN